MDFFLDILKPRSETPVRSRLKEGSYIVGRGGPAKIRLPYADVSEYIFTINLPDYTFCFLINVHLRRS